MAHHRPSAFSALSGNSDSSRQQHRNLNTNLSSSSVSPGSHTTSKTTSFGDEPDVIIAVMGATGTGKTSFINHASGASLRIGKGLKSCTSSVQIASTFELDGKSVALIDTPGFDDTTKSDADVLRMIAAFLEITYEHGRKLTGVIYIHRISDFRMTGISSRNFKMFRQLCGDNTLKNVIILTNMWGEVSQEIGEAREYELRTQDLFFKPVLDRGATLLRHENNRESALNVLRHIIDSNPVTLQIQRELVLEKKDISETAAGAELNKEHMEQIRKHRQELEAIKKEMQEAIRTQDEETRRELEAETQKLQDEMQKVQRESQQLASQYSEEKRRIEQRMEEITQNSRYEAESAAAEHNQRINDLQAELFNTSSAAAEQSETLQRQIEELNRRNRWQAAGGFGFFGKIGSALDALFGII